MTWLLKQACKQAACQCLFSSPLPPLLEKLHALRHDHKINTGKGVGGLGGEVSEALGSTSGQRSTRIATGSKVYSGFNFTF